jgi:hypothetical protein
MQRFVLATVAVIFAMPQATTSASVSAWDGFSSQSAYPYSVVTTSATAQPGIAVLHASAAYGVPSSAGLPEHADSCNDLRTTLIPLARRLANARALAFASELGVELGQNLREDVEPPYTNPFFHDPSGCGIPKLGRAPFGTFVDESFAIQKPAFLPETPATAFAPEPATVLDVNDFTETPPLVPFEDLRSHLVRARGYASERPDTVALDVLLADTASAPVITSNSRQQDLTRLEPTLAAIRRVAPSALVDPTARTGASGVGAHTIVASARVTVDNPSSTIVAEIDRAMAASSDPSVDVYVSRSSMSASCETLEAGALRDAIARARAEIAASGEATGAIDLTFADEQPPQFVGGICGPKLDGFLFPDTREARKDAEIPLAIGAYVSIELRYHLHRAY